MKPLKSPPLKKSSKLQALVRLKEIHNYDYTTFVANQYRAESLTVWEYSKEKNLVNYPLNLVIKKERDILFIQCRSNMGRVSLENLMEFKNIGTTFIEQYPLFEKYNILYLYICSEDSFSDEALEDMGNSTHISYIIMKEHD